MAARNLTRHVANSAWLRPGIGEPWARIRPILACSTHILKGYPQGSQRAPRFSESFQKVVEQFLQELRIGPNSDNIGRFGANFGRLGRVWSIRARCWSMWDKVGQHFAKRGRLVRFGPNRPKLGPDRQAMVEFSQLGQTLAERSQRWPNLGRVSAPRSSVPQLLCNWTTSELAEIGGGNSSGRVPSNSAGTPSAETRCLGFVDNFVAGSGALREFLFGRVLRKAPYAASL